MSVAPARVAILTNRPLPLFKEILDTFLLKRDAHSKLDLFSQK